MKDTGSWGRRGRHTLFEFITKTPDGTRVTDDSFEKRHRIVLFSIAIQLPILFAISQFTGLGALTGVEFPSIPFSHSFAGVGGIAAIATLAAVPSLSRRTRSLLASFGFMTCAAVLAYFWGGFIEAHFLYFVGVGVVALYEDWVPFAVSILYVVFQHSIFGVVGGIHVYNHPAAMQHPVAWGVIHGIFVAGLAIAILLHWQSLESTHLDLDERVADIEALEQKQKEVDAARQEAETQRANAAQLNQSLREEAAIMGTALTAVADRDLSKNPPTDSNITAMQEVSSAYFRMTRDLSAVVTDLRSFAQNVEQTTDTTYSRADALQHTQHEHAEDVRSLSNQLRTQAEKLETASDEMNNLSAVIEEIASSTEEVSVESTRVAENSQEANKQIQTAVTVMDDVERRVSTVTELIETMSDRMDSVESATSLIDEIADRTNILALNASIEAARAGGNGNNAGDGFTVVADEVKNLATQTQQHSATIQSDIETTLSDVSTVQTNIQTLSSSITDSRNTVVDTGSIFEDVNRSMSNLEASTNEVSRAIDEGAATTEEVTQAIMSVAEGARTLATTGDRVANSSEETAIEIGNIKSDLSALGEQTTTLRKELDQFIIRDLAELNQVSDDSSATISPK